MVDQPRRGLAALVRLHLAKEDERTTLLTRRLSVARDRGYLTRGELLAVCRWKSARAIHRVAANDHHRVRATTRAAMAARTEGDRLDALVELHGVSVPMASAILTLLYPSRYGVIDIRVWQFLHGVGAVGDNERGTKFTAGQWLAFLAIIRRLSRRLRVSPRAVERTLFALHKAHQRKRLYG